MIANCNHPLSLRQASTTLQHRSSNKMEQEETFNSSDVDMGPPPKHFWDDVGKLSVASMLGRAMQDRMQSKRSSKHLSDQVGSPCSIYQRNLWGNRLDSYRS